MPLVRSAGTNQCFKKKNRDPVDGRTRPQTGTPHGHRPPSEATARLSSNNNVAQQGTPSQAARDHRRGPNASTDLFQRPPPATHPTNATHFSGPILWPHAADGRDPRARDPTRDPRQHNPPYPTLHGRWRIRSLNCPTWGRNGRGGKGVALPSKCPLFCQPRY